MSPCGVHRAALQGGFNLDDQEEALLEVPQEETQPQRAVRTPSMPTAAEMEQHRSDGHLPYRDWCPDCVEGFG